MTDPLPGYDERFLICRESHDLPYGDRADHWQAETRGGRRGYRRVMMCRRCAAIVTDWLDARTGQNTRAIRHPDGYRLPREAHVTRRTVRLERVRRLQQEPPR